MSTLDSLIHQKRTIILETFVSELRVYRLAPAHRTHAEIAAGLDDYLTAVANAVGRGYSKDPEALRLATLHGDQRVRIGYDLMALVKEFGILRATVVEVARQSDALSVVEMERLADVLHLSMLAALARFLVAHDGKTMVTAVHVSAAAAHAAGQR